VKFNVDSIRQSAPDVAAVAPDGWNARLVLKCQRIGERSLLTERSHTGPLRLLKALYPEGEQICHAVIVHPPGGIVAGDELAVDITVADGGHLLVTTPGTQKWYRSLGRSASANTELQVDAASALEWLPQESMVFDRAQIEQRLSVRVAEDGRFFGWEILCLGRTTRNERFTQGSVRQRLEIIRDDALVWCENTLLRGDDPLLSSVLGLQHMPVVATAWIAFPPNECLEDVLLAKVRAALDTEPLAAASRPAPGLIVIKVVGTSAEPIRQLLSQVWSTIREAVFGVAPATPRIWST
jgi:urease accessory protein